MLTEDVALVEELQSTFDTVGGYGLLVTGLPATADHFMQAASPCLARFVPIWLHPFRGPHQIFTSLNAPLTGPEHDWIRAEDAAFLRDVLRLTGGNPYELMLVGHHLWRTCKCGEQDSYALTPRVLDHIIPRLSLLASGGDALLDGANAIDRLADEHVQQAVELVAMSRLTVREIAIARILRIHSRDADRVDRAILTADIAEECGRILSELEQLQEAGVVQLHANQASFSVVGGRPAAVLLKYQARARIGAKVSDQPFELDFLFAVGRALVRDATLRTMEAVEGSVSLGFTAVMSERGAGRLSPRPAIRSLGTSGGIRRLIQAEIDLIPWNRSGYDRIAALLTEDDPAIALVYTAVTNAGEELEYTELWELPDDVTHEDVAEAWSTVTEEWEPVVAAAELKWNGSEFVVLRGESARQALIVLQRFAARSAVQLLFARWYEDGDEDALTRAHQMGDGAIAAMRATGLSELELAGELSGMLSRVGFLKSFDDALLNEARAALEAALQTGDADEWVTKWNLANVTARQGDARAALRHLDDVEEALKDWQGNAFVLVYVPGRAVADCIVKITDVGIGALLKLQRAVLTHAIDADNDCLKEAVDCCRASADSGAVQAAHVVVSLPAVAG